MSSLSGQPWHAALGFSADRMPSHLDGSFGLCFDGNIFQDYWIIIMNKFLWYLKAQFVNRRLCKWDTKKEANFFPFLVLGRQKPVGPSTNLAQACQYDELLHIGESQWKMGGEERGHKPKCGYGHWEEHVHLKLQSFPSYLKTSSFLSILSFFHWISGKKLQMQSLSSNLEKKMILILDMDPFLEP